MIAGFEDLNRWLSKIQFYVIMDMSRELA